MQPASADINTLDKFKPDLSLALYNTKVDVVGNHLSGLLLIKSLTDHSTRLVFSNEMGYTYFDFEFDSSGNFKVHSIIKQMDKRSVLKTLRKDLELVLMNTLDKSGVSIRSSDNFVYFIFPRSKGFNYYITDSTGNQLLRMERASNKKTVVEAIMKNYVNGVPDTIGITHKNFDFTIGLKRIER
ncbi:MAG: hypothetical protein ABIO04_03935 [Ferruginibacter sp.]